MNQPQFLTKWQARRDQIQSLLCVGLDPDIEQLPLHYLSLPKPQLAFGQFVLKTHAPYATSWKPNIAFFERFGSRGLLELEEWVKEAKSLHPEIPILMDAKRGDLANTAKEYASYYFENLGVDALTVQPYMGFDTIKPYLDIGGFVFILCLTSNPSSKDLQRVSVGNSSQTLYLYLLDLILEWERNYPKQIGIVVGGTHPQDLIEIRKRSQEIPILIPGYGAQGGSLPEILSACGKNSLVNSSRSLTLLSKSIENESLCQKAGLELHRNIQGLYSQLV